MLKEVSNNPKVSSRDLQTATVDASCHAYMYMFLRSEIFSWEVCKEENLAVKKHQGKTEFAREHLDKEEDFWTNESKMKLFGHNNR